eukprot:CAMPEP_0117601890 /NCGR_PEP_ID=MMETSP0784-20121206/77279_1 /TAXON_ID=39447 /ORGANISM="" /LENGTH=38 /DNA_ID= /DNA_START= /DNA_END= /DNA_ORIENTATION=
MECVANGQVMPMRDIDIKTDILKLWISNIAADHHDFDV